MAQQIISARFNSGIVAESNTECSVLSDEELLYLGCNEKERRKIMEVKVTHNRNTHSSPAIRVDVDTPDGYHDTFWLVCSACGFNISKADTNEICAYTILNRNLKEDCDSLDIDSLRGFAALAFINLEHILDKHIDAFDMIYSPAFTEYLHSCTDFLKSVKA